VDIPIRRRIINGGETNFGITKAVAMENSYNGDMKDIPIDVVRNIYKTKYWDMLHLDAIEKYSIAIAIKLFQMSINIGPHTTSTIFQKCINLFIKDEIQEDGIIGDNTLLKFYKIVEHDKENIIKTLNLFQGYLYIKICQRDKDQKIFYRGWLSRAFL